jgi:hypothetical protein
MVGSGTAAASKSGRGVVAQQPGSRFRLAHPRFPEGLHGHPVHRRVIAQLGVFAMSATAKLVCVYCVKEAAGTDLSTMDPVNQDAFRMQLPRVLPPGFNPADIVGSIDGLAAALEAVRSEPLPHHLQCTLAALFDMARRSRNLSGQPTSTTSRSARTSRSRRTSSLWNLHSLRYPY